MHNRDRDIRACIYFIIFIVGMAAGTGLATDTVPMVASVLQLVLGIAVGVTAVIYVWIAGILT